MPSIDIRDYEDIIEAYYLQSLERQRQEDDLRKVLDELELTEDAHCVDEEGLVLCE